MPYMDQTKQNNIQILGELTTQFQFPKKPIQILLSISAFSILFSLFPFFPLFSNYITTLSLQIFSYTADRNYIFLFCNGILAFLIKTSTSDADQDRVEKIFEYCQISGPEVAEKRELVREEIFDELKKEKVEKKDTILTTSQDEREENEEEEFIGGQEEEEEEEEVMGLMSAEELNKKCEEFIWKMREGIKIEAQNRLLIMV